MERFPENWEPELSTPNDCCPVCLGIFEYRVSTPCKHYFCRRCLNKVYHMSPTNKCPLCRSSFEYYIKKRRTMYKIVFLS